MTDLLLMENIVKRFGSFIANDHIDLDVRHGEIHALLGENGAGKTTLMNILYGIYQPDEGKIFLHGKEVMINSPKDSISLRIGMIHQNFMLIPKFSVLENIILGIDSGLNTINQSKKADEIICFAENIGIHIDPFVTAGSLSVGEQQRVEILKALYRGADLLILDEPTSVLTPQECCELFISLKQMAEKGMSAIFISHKLDEVMEVSDRVSVLQRGKKIATCDTESISKKQLVNFMIGRNITACSRIEAKTGKDSLIVKNIFVQSNYDDIYGLDDISFSVGAGEIYGIGGVDGNGQQELAEALIGLRPVKSGNIFLDGIDLSRLSIFNRSKIGVAYIPADRKLNGIFQTFDLTSNLLAKQIVQRNPIFCRGGFLQKDEMSDTANEIILQNDIRIPSNNSLLRNLSGGNQQKVVIARELFKQPKLLVVSQVTQGLDLGAAEHVRKKVQEISESGTSVVYISSDLEELLEMCDRIMILFRGKSMGVFKTCENYSLENIGLMMTGNKLCIDRSVE